jgi:hypothetical protein
MSNAHKAYKQVKDKDRLEQYQKVFIIADTDNKYDPNALAVMIQTPLGRSCLGYVPAMRYCPLCDPEMKGRKFKSYGPAQIDDCPECGTYLIRSSCEIINKALKDGARIESKVLFYGATEELKNIGAVVYADIFIDEEEVLLEQAKEAE